MFSITFNAGSGIPHVFMNVSGGLKLHDKKVISVTPIKTVFQTLKPVTVTMSCGHSVSGIIKLRNAGYAVPEVGMYLTCPNCERG